jgi:hypothetical protein
MTFLLSLSRRETSGHERKWRGDNADELFMLELGSFPDTVVNTLYTDADEIGI